MEKLNVRFSEDAKKEIELMAKNLEMSFSAVAREALKLGLVKMKKKAQ